MTHYTDGRHWNDKTKAWEFDEKDNVSASGSNDLLSGIDDGPWNVINGSDGNVLGIMSDDFKHDALLSISGDFASDEVKREYCRLLCVKLNA